MRAIILALVGVALTAAAAAPADDDDAKAINLSALGSAPLGAPSRETGRRVATFDASAADAGNPEELGEYFEGDILFPGARNGLVAEVSRWPNGEIPYVVAGGFGARELALIADAMDAYAHYTCVRFRPRVAAADVDYLSLESAATGCWSSVGRVGGKQVVNLQTPGCFAQVGTAIHELMHAAGFMHEQNRFERDDNVDIVWANIQAGRDNNFQKSDARTVSARGVPYDFHSVMHYSAKAFSKNGRPTIVARRHAADGDDVQMGQRAGFSKGDVLKLRRMYHCPNADADLGDDAPVKAEQKVQDGGLGNILSMIFG